MKKREFLPLFLIALLFLSSCGRSDAPESKSYRVGDRFATPFFRCTVTDAYRRQSYHGVMAGEGQRLIVVELTIENTQDYSLPMSRYDFRLQLSEELNDYAYPLTSYCDAQLPDDYEIPEDEKQTGTLVFRVPEEIRDMALGYLEIFEDDHQGDAHFVYFTV